MNASVFSKECTQTFSSDLACERRRADTAAMGVSYSCERCPCGNWERINIFSEEGSESIGRPMGNYDTLNTKRLDTLDFDEADDAKNEISSELCTLLEKNRIFPSRILVVGLGNEALAPDAVGPYSAALIKPTMHISAADKKMFDGLECSEIAVIKPGVLTSSGMESADFVKSICQSISPDAVIAIDALASRAPERLGTTVQICDTGIFPGAGLGNRSKAINRDFLGVPVIAIGVPTVIDSRMFGGEITGMFVAPKDINAIANSAAKIIAGGINQAFGIDF